MSRIIRMPVFVGCLAVVLSGAVLGPGGSRLWAQVAGGAAKEPPAAPAPEKQEKSIGQVLLEKTNPLGWAFYIVEGTVSIVALTVVLERLVNLRLRRMMPRRFVRRLRDLIARREDTPETLRNLCESSESPIANVLRAGLLRVGQPLPQVEKAMEDALGREVAAQRSRNRALSTIAYIAPLIGLLGTVVGMILAFQEVTRQARKERIEAPAKLAAPVQPEANPSDDASKEEKLAEGIYLALLRTAFGLLIAVPAFVCAHWFNNRIERYSRVMIDMLEEMTPTLFNPERYQEGSAAVLHASGPLGRVSPS